MPAFGPQRGGTPTPQATGLLDIAAVGIAGWPASIAIFPSEIMG